MPNFFEVDWDDQFWAELRVKLGLTQEIFANLGMKGIEEFLWRNPYDDRATWEVPESGGTRMLSTREYFGDVPAMYVYFNVDSLNRRLKVFACDRESVEDDFLPF